MAKRSISYEKTKIDPFFIIPRGSEDEFVFSRDDADSYDDGTDDSVYLDSGTIIDDVSDPKATLDVPEDFYILSQTIRRTAGGQEVIDVIIMCEQVKGAVKYEIQVAKA